ncbi:MAG: hypothetical protein MdMp024_1206 [Bacteroidales bacterium]
MFSSDLLQSFFTPEGLIAILLAIVIIAPYMLFFFRKGIVKQLVEECGIATKKDLDDLRKEQKADIQDLNGKMERMRKEMEANDAKLRKALLLLANQSIDDPERIERIKDLLTI